MTFSQRYDATVRTLEEKLTDLIDNGAEFDLERNGDVLTIEFESGEKVIITPNSPVEQLWISAEFQGQRFNWSEDANAWSEEKAGKQLARYLSEVLTRKLGTPIELSQ